MERRDMTEEKAIQGPEDLQGIIREGEDALEWAEGRENVHCFVRHPDAGGACERPAVMEVYGLPFCEIHGVEAKAGALAEIYDAADMDLDRLDNGQAPWQNPVTGWRIEQARVKVHEQAIAASRAEKPALLRAYPVIPERVDIHTRDYDYWTPTEDLTPADSFSEARRLLHKMMRIAHGGGDSWLVEDLEYKREGASAQLAFALEDFERRARTEQMAPINSALSEAAQRMERLDPEGFADPEDYWRAAQAIAQAGSIVSREQTRRRRGTRSDPARGEGEARGSDPPESGGRASA